MMRAYNPLYIMAKPPLIFDRIENRKAVTLRMRDPLSQARAFQAALPPPANAFSGKSHLKRPELIPPRAVASLMKHILAATGFALSLAACSPAPDASAPANDTVAPTDTATPAPVPPPGEGPATTPTPVPPPPETADAQTLTLEGLGPLKIGQPVSASSGFAERGAQASDSCRTVTSPAYPGVYAIVERGAVRRITAGQRATVKLVEGIGVGATEKAVMADFAGFRSTPHKYVEAPAKYLTAPNAESGDPALRFEIGRDGKVSLIHIGTMPVLGYVEGCS